MLKTFFTLLRGGIFAQEQKIADQNALLILDQQIRDSAQALNQAKRSLAIALAQQKQESAHIIETNIQINDLESRVKQALQAKRDDLAHEGASAIAELEAEVTSSTVAQSLFEKEITRLRHHVANAEMRITALDRGRRVAKATAAVSSLRHGRIEESSLFKTGLNDAEATLKRFQEKAFETHNAEDELDLLEKNSHISAREKLSSEGFGSRLKTTAEDVLSRLKTQIA